MFDGYREQLVAAIHNQGHDAKLIHAPSPPFRWDDVGCSYRETFPKDACVISHGDIELVTRIHQERRWTPGAFCAVENFACCNYTCYYGNYLLNRDYIMLPFGELDRCKDFLFDTVGRDDRVFVRPDSPLKLFTGQIATRDTFAADLEFMGFYEFPVNSLVVVSSPKQILNEWRFVVANGKVIAGCQYKNGDNLDYQADYDGNAFDLAQSIAAIDYEPDPVWVMDICKTSDNSYHLLEIGGFSFADLYACNMADVVAAVSAVAKDVWENNVRISNR
ncbi:MAG: ATP-grasp domain-containing protein [Betaproteobacteria bacterium]